MKKFGIIFFLLMLLTVGSFSIISARIIGPPCDRVIDYNAGINQSACHDPGGNCCWD